MKKINICLCISLFATLFAIGNVYAQNFPPSTIKIVVPFPPGGPTDIIARLVAQALSEKLKANVLVDNKAGASAMVGSSVVAQSAPDGSTLLFNATHQVTNSVFFKKLPYDVMKDFTPIALVASVPSVLIVNRNVPVNSTAELIALAKKDPSKLSFATFGGANQLSTELFKSMAGIDVINISYKGESPALNDVIAGHVPMMFDTLSTVLPHLSNNKIIPLGVPSSQRSTFLPDVPTIAESGGPLSGYEAIAWFGLFMPAANGNIAQTKLTQAMSEILSSEVFRKKLIAMGAEPSNITGAAFNKFVNSELIKWREVGRKANIEQQ